MRLVHKILLITAISLMPLSPVFCMQDDGSKENQLGIQCLNKRAAEYRKKKEEGDLSKEMDLSYVWEAIPYFLRSIDLGCDEAKYSLAIAYFRLSTERPKYENKAIKLMSEAANQGVKKADDFLLAFGYPRQ